MMRRFVILALLAVGGLVLPGTGSAKEIQAGTWEFTGDTSLNFGSSSLKPQRGNDLDTDSLSFDLTGQYYLMPNFAVGLLWSYENSETEIGGDEAESTSNLLGPTLEMDLGLTDVTNLFFRASVGFAKFEEEINGLAEDIDGFFYGVEGGAKFFLTESVSLNASLSYTAGELEDDVDVDFDSVDLDAGFSLYF